MADRSVLGVSAASCDRAHHDFASVHADAALQRIAAVGDQLGRVATKFFLHAESRIERALRMVLVRDRRAEQREDAVAGALHDVAVVAADRVDHQLERRIDDRARLFGIEVLFEFGRALDIGEQRGDRLALAFEVFSGGRVSYPNRRIVRFPCGRSWSLHERAQRIRHRNSRRARSRRRIAGTSVREARRISRRICALRDFQLRTWRNSSLRT